MGIAFFNIIISKYLVWIRHENNLLKTCADKIPTKKLIRGIFDEENNRQEKFSPEKCEELSKKIRRFSLTKF